MAAQSRGASSLCRIEGLDQFIRALDATPSHWPNVTRMWQRESVAYIASEARGLATDGVQRRAKYDIRPVGADSLVYGGKPYDMGAEFGALKYHQFKAWLGNGEEAGYFFFPAIRSYRANMMEALYANKLDMVTRGAFNR